MPELPEVETVVRNLRAPLIGRTVQEMWYEPSRTIHSPSPQDFEARIVGQTFQSIDRRAKYIIATLDHDLLVVHLKMTGRLYVVKKDSQHEADRWLRFSLQLENDYELRFSDSRRFGRVYLTTDFASISPGAATLGPEPLEESFTAAMFAQRAHGRNKSIKALLLDQSFIAGVGNIYADEALFCANIHPMRAAASLSEDECARLYETVRAALQKGIAQEGASVNWYRKPDGERGSAQESLFVYGRTGEPCVVCGTPISKLRVAQRGTHICAQCQPLTLT